MTYAPQNLRDLMALWVSEGGVNLGIVGNARHLKGYHLGKDRIFDGSGPGLGSADYSVQTKRDKAGLTNAAAAVDLGRLDGSLPALYRFSRWLVKRCQERATGTSAIREIIYSPDGAKVLRYDRERGATSSPRPGEADNSHLTHTHISFYRDTEGRDLRPLFRPYFAVAPAPEDDMPVISSYSPGLTATVTDPAGTANVRSAPSLAAPLVRAIPKGSSESWAITGWVKGEVYAASDQWACRWGPKGWEYTHKSNVPTVIDATPFGPAEVAAAYEKGKAEGDQKHVVTLSIGDKLAYTTEV